MSERPPPGATFEVSPLGQGPQRRPTAPLVWAGLLVALVVFAVLGRGSSLLPSDTPTPPVNIADLGSLVPAPADPVFRAPTEARAGPPELDALITLDASTGDSEAAPGHQVARRVLVAGTVFVRAEQLLVTIESSSGRVIGSQRILIDTEAVIRPARSPELNLSFTLPARVTDGRVWVAITALDATGLVVGELRREVAIGLATRTWLERPLNLMN
jgi:hypothetical protein